jgi:hypothetical protein
MRFILASLRARRGGSLILFKDFLALDARLQRWTTHGEAKELFHSTDIWLRSLKQVTAVIPLY